MNVDSIREIKDQHSPRLLSLPGITAVGVGYLDDDETIGIIVHREGGDDTTIPNVIDGIPVEVRPGRFSSPFATLVAEAEPSAPPSAGEERRDLGNPRDKEVNPMIGGITCNPDFFWGVDWEGTLGIAVSNSQGLPVVLSNRHVICRKDPQVGDGVSQPSYEIFSHLAASLTSWELGNVDYLGRSYGMDAAIATPTNNRTATVGHVYGLPPVTGSAAPALRMGVHKSGVTTDITTGTVTQIDTDCLTSKNVILRNQVIVRASNYPAGKFAEEGDSGSVIIDRVTDKVIALLWGENSAANEAIGSPIDAVLHRFGCTIP